MCPTQPPRRETGGEGSPLAASQPPRRETRGEGSQLTERRGESTSPTAPSNTSGEKQTQNPTPTRRPSPMGGKKPTKQDLARFATANPRALDDVLPPSATPLNLLIVGINPGLWTAAVNAPFARPGNRFWPALHRAGLTDYLVDASLGLSADDEQQFYMRGMGLTNLVGRATARADELSISELKSSGAHLVERIQSLKPKVVALAGITAYRAAFSQPKAAMGRQTTTQISGWPASSLLWVVPQPSGLNAHETIDSLAQYWRLVWEDVESQ